jgi:hypothetical protein
MVDSINRWLTHPVETIRAHITETFGTDEAVKIALGGGDRAIALKDLYQRQLQHAARFVRYFDMRDHDNRTVYYLFFASNNAVGHLKMKEAMWRVDPLGDFSFSDATDPSFSAGYYTLVESGFRQRTPPPSDHRRAGCSSLRGGGVCCGLLFRYCPACLNVFAFRVVHTGLPEFGTLLAHIWPKSARIEALDICLTCLYL